MSDLVKNNSYSGTTICNYGYNGVDTTTSFIGRFKKDIESDFFSQNKVDTLLIFGGTNDSWANEQNKKPDIGELKLDNWTDEDLQQVLPGFCYLLHIAKEALPNTRIVVILNTDSNTQITDGYKEACNKNDIKFLELENISKQSGHPNIAGIKQISSQLTPIF